MTDRNVQVAATGDASPRRVASTKKIGLIVNPIAGMGGRVGLKGTDGADVLDEARRRGARPVSSERALQALKKLAASKAEFSLVTAQGELGEDVALQAGLHPVVVHGKPHAGSTPADTREAVAAMLREAGVDPDEGTTQPAQEGRSQVMALMGKAGSGKTLLLSELCKALDSAGAEIVSGDYESRRKGDKRSFAVLAPTNKAASVLRSELAPAP